MNLEIDFRGMSERAKQARRQSGLTQEKLAEITDMDCHHISRIETGTVNFGLKAVVRISVALGISTDYLLFGTKNES